MVAFTHVAGELQGGVVSDTITIAGISLTADRLYLLTVAANNDAFAELADPVDVSQPGFPADEGWEFIASIGFAADLRRKVAMYRAQPSQNVESSTITVNWNGITDRHALLAMSDDTVMVDSANNGAAAIVQAEPAAGDGTAIAATLAAFADPDNATFVGAGAQATPTITSEWGPSSILNQQGAGGLTSVHAYLASEDTTPTLTRSDSNTWGIVALEVAASGTPPPPAGPQQLTIVRGGVEVPIALDHSNLILPAGGAAGDVLGLAPDGVTLTWITPA